MKQYSTLQGMVSALIGRGAKLLEPFGITEDSSIISLCEVLLTSRGEASGIALATRVLDTYQSFEPEQKLAFFQALADRFDPEKEVLEGAIQSYLKEPSADALVALSSAAEAPRQELLRRLNQSPGGTAALVSMHADLLQYLSEHKNLKRINHDFSHLLASWFNRGFLQLRRVTWSSPADILEKIIDYEAVHEIADWDELRRRLQPSDRRCYAFFHPTMPDEPLVFVEVALTQKIADNISELLSDERDVLTAEAATTAVFYSISNCQAGLRGVSFGNFLIKQVVSELLLELPNLKTFITLSPAPGLGRWLAEQSNTEHASAAQELIELSHQFNDKSDLQKKRHAQLANSLAAKYYLQAKRSDGSPPDPVARFHLGNGASLEHIHPQANLTATGLRSSAGVMVNYHYDLSKIEENHEAYAADRSVNASRSVRALLGRASLLKPNAENS